MVVEKPARVRAVSFPDRRIKSYFRSFRPFIT
jgi:hypothetical protein